MKRCLVILALVAVTVCVFAGPEVTVQAWKDGQNFGGPPRANSWDVNGIKVIWDNVTIDMKYYVKLKADIAAGTLPDIVHLPTAGNLMTYKDYFQSIEPFAVKDLGANWKTKYYPPTIVKAMDFFGKDWRWLPAGACADNYLWYNKDVLDKYGLKVPKNMQELKQVSKVLLANGIVPLATGGADAWPLTFIFISIAIDYDKDGFWDADAGRSSWNKPWMIQALKTWQDLTQSKIIVDGYSTLTLDNARQMLMEGKAAMICEGSWSTFWWTNEPYKSMIAKDTILPARLPDFNGDGIQPPPYGGPDVTVCLSASTKDPESAYKIAKWTSIGEGAMNFSNYLLTFPGATTVKMDWNFVKNTVQPSNFDLVKKIHGLLLADMKDWVGRREPLRIDAFSIFQEYLVKLTNNQITPEGAAKELDDIFTKQNLVF
jgi:raffinose/stachyose/melibiose transport system substrate-binding protein